MTEETMTNREYIDPICGMTVKPETAAAKYETKSGETVYFCSNGCLEKYKKQFETAPQTISMAQISREKPTADEINALGEMTEIDPICGMTITPETAAAKYETENGKTVYFCAESCKNKYVSHLENGDNKIIEPAKANISRHNGEKVVSHGEMKAAPEGSFIDPVCGMSVAPETAAGKYEFEGETYYFCSPSCLSKFKQNPKNFLEEKQEEKLEAESQGTEYTCPMHPEIIQIGPGSCPICGMALEPKVISLDDAPDPELIDMKRRFWISAALTVPVFILAMAEMFPAF